MPKIPDKPDKPVTNSNKKVPANQGNELLDVFTSSRCKVCQSKWRVNVDMMLIRGFSVRKIAESYRQPVKILVIVLCKGTRNLILI